MSSTSIAGGFSLLDLLITVVLLVALAAVVVPVVENDLHDSSRVQAQSECNRIATAIIQYAADTGAKPCGYEGTPSYSYLRSDGSQPTLPGMIEGAAGKLEWFLVKNYMSDEAVWGGPYLRELRPDPWGRQYVTYVGAWWPAPKSEPTAGKAPEPRPQANVWVLSAGPDGVIETRPEDIALVGDDVGVRIE